MAVWQRCEVQVPGGRNGVGRDVVPGSDIAGGGGAELVRFVESRTRKRVVGFDPNTSPGPKRGELAPIQGKQRGDLRVLGLRRFVGVGVGGDVANAKKGERLGGGKCRAPNHAVGQIRLGSSEKVGGFLGTYDVLHSDLSIRHK